MTKSAASAASMMTKTKGASRTTAQHTDDRGQGLPCLLVIREAALAVDLMSARECLPGRLHEQQTFRQIPGLHST